VISSNRSKETQQIEKSIKIVKLTRLAVLFLLVLAVHPRAMGQETRGMEIPLPKVDPLCTVIKLEFNQVIRIDRKAGELQEGEL
jgi:hypothetical protein